MVSGELQKLPFDREGDEEEKRRGKKKKKGERKKERLAQGGGRGRKERRNGERGTDSRERKKIRYTTRDKEVNKY